MLQKSISNVVEDKIFSVIAEERDFGAKPKMVWQDPHKMERLKYYVNSKLLTVDIELENIIRKTEKLPELKVETARPAENEGKDDFEERIEKKKKDKIPGEVK